MDNETLYAIFGIIGFLIVITISFRSGGSAQEIKTKYQKRAEVIEDYKSQLKSELKDLSDYNEMKKKKVTLLVRYSDELSRNIFFDAKEIKSIIEELAED